MRPHIDLKRMRYIVEVARAEAITKAAQALSITQPALTRNIAEVEEELGIQIFHRLPRGIELTEEGEEFVARATQILGDVDNLISEMRDNKGPPTGRLRIGVAPPGFVNYTSDAVQDLASDYPGVSIEIISGSAQTICPRLLHGELHLVIGFSSYLEKWRELEVHRLRPLDYGIMMRKDHPLTRVDILHEVDILKYPAILPASVEPVYSDIATRFAANNLPPMQPQYVTDSWGVVTKLVEATDAFYPITDSRANMERLAESFFVVQNVVKMQTSFVGLAYSPLRPKTDLADLFEELLIKRLA